MRAGGPDTTRGDTASFNPSPRSQARRERSSANRARSARNDTKPKAPTTSTAESQMAARRRIVKRMAIPADDADYNKGTALGTL